MGVVENIKDAFKVLQASDNMDILKSYIAIENEFYALKTEINSLKEENKDLKRKLEINEIVYLKNNAYYFLYNDIEKGPFCTKCYDDEKKLITMQEKDNGISMVNFECPKCKNTYLKRKYTQDEIHKIAMKMNDMFK